MQDTLTFEKLSWAAFMARVFQESGPGGYMTIYEDTAFRNNLVHSPANLSLQEIQSTLIGGFLNKWRSRFPNNDESAEAIRAAVQGVSSAAQAAQGLRIETVNMDSLLQTTDGQISVFQASSMVFNALAWCHGFRPTPAAKMMGVVNPELFVMWDQAIAWHYREDDASAYIGDGYAMFLRKMQMLAQQCVEDFEKRFGQRDPAAYLSSRLGLSSPLPLAKFIDEYNWITITNRTTVPPRWHPCDDE
jgi:hypothetical protein